MQRQSVAVALMAVILGAAVARAEMVEVPLDFYLRLEWQAGPPKGGSPTIHGYIFNKRALFAERVVLLIEALDASSQVAGKTTIYINGQIPAFGYSAFETRVPAGATYRFTLVSVTWQGGINGSLPRGQTG